MLQISSPKLHNSTSLSVNVVNNRLQEMPTIGPHRILFPNTYHKGFGENKHPLDFLLIHPNLTKARHLFELSSTTITKVKWV